MTIAVIFANPALWAGAFAIGIPLIIHILTRRRPVRFVFPTLRFIKAAQASQSKIYKLRHWVMLILRTACIALVLFAFLKPILEAGTLAGAENKEGKTVSIIVLDGSLSMNYSGAGFTPFARARLAAEKIADNLKANDPANLILATASPRASFDEPSTNRFHLKRDIQNAAPTLERADIDAAIAEAVKQFVKYKDYRKEIHFISDFQRSNWSSVHFAAIPKDVKTVFVSVAEPSATNTAVTEVLMQPPLPAVSEEVEIICKILNDGKQPKDLPVQLRFGDEKVMKQSLSLQPNSTGSATFRILPRRSGIFEGEVSIPDDALNADNKRFFTLNVSERVHLLVLSDEDRFDPGASHRFLMRAVHPFRDRDSGTVTAELLPSGKFDKFAAGRAHAVLISGVSEFSDAAAGALLKYLRDGGGVMMFLTGQADAANLKKLEKLAGGELKLPFQLEQFVDVSGKEQFTFLTEANFDDPILKKFREAGDLPDIRFFRYFATKRVAGEGQVLMRYDDKNFALAKKSVDLGSLMICNFSASVRASDLAKRAIFVPFVHELIRGVRPQSGGARSFTVGHSASTTVRLSSAGTDIRFTNPAGEKIGASIEMSKGEAAVIFEKTKESGFYRIFEANRPQGAVAVNVDGRESQLESLSEQQLRELTEISRERFFSATGGDIEELKRLREGQPIWQYCLLLALLILGMEQVLAILWRR